MDNNIILVTIPEYYQAEVSWVLEVIFTGFLGLPYEVSTSNKKDNPYILINYLNKTLSNKNKLLNESEENWKTDSSLPKLPLSQWDTRKTQLDINLTNSLVPIIYGEEGYSLDENQNTMDKN